MELTWIDDFLALEKTRNFTRAAEMRCTTQSAYSRRIARLEDWLGTRLFLRDTRPVQLTQQGQEFLGRARSLRTDMLDAQRAVQVLDSRFEHPVRLYTTNTLAVGFLPQVADSLATKFSGEKLSYRIASVTGCHEALGAGHADAIIVPHFEDDNMPLLHDATILGQDSLCLMASAGMARKIVHRNRKLEGPVMMYPPGIRYGHMADRMLQAHQLTLAQNPVCESTSAEALVALAASGHGAAFVPVMLGKAAGLVPCGPPKSPKSLSCPYDIVLIKKLLKC